MKSLLLALEAMTPTELDHLADVIEIYLLTNGEVHYRQ